MSRLRVCVLAKQPFVRLLGMELAAMTQGTNTKWLPAPAPLHGFNAHVSPMGLLQLVHRTRLASSIQVIYKSKRKLRAFYALEKHLLNIPWHLFFARGSQPRNWRDVPWVQAKANKESALYHQAAIKERAENALLARLGMDEDAFEAAAVQQSEEGVHPDSNPRTQHVSVSLYRDYCTVGVNVGHPLHKRGYRQHVVETPMQENVAAACLTLAFRARAHAMGWGHLTTHTHSSTSSSHARAEEADIEEEKEEEVMLPPDQMPSKFWDPFCGSGTFVFEALDLKHRAVQVLPRTFPFQAWPSSDPVEIKEALLAMKYGKPVVGSTVLPMAEDCRLPLIATDGDGVAFVGSDLRAKAIDSCTHNRAQMIAASDSNLLGAYVSFEQGDFLKAGHETSNPEFFKKTFGATIVTNLPWQEGPGARNTTQKESIASLYARFADWLYRRPDLKHVFVVVRASSEHNQALTVTGCVEWKRLAQFNSAGIAVQLMQLVRKS
jgi:23S rRNA G2445 N2-methylase RlmL